MMFVARKSVEEKNIVCVCVCVVSLFFMEEREREREKERGKGLYNKNSLRSFQRKTLLKIVLFYIHIRMKINMLKRKTIFNK